ncbi:N-acetylmuramoyl-L-alanine amidase [Paenalkalicoccus suaedae]|uniref:Autolysin n=1 Tax=Paenalkalicoccus suaedae TaxID=2592382 RepID=A0A859FFP9_9BACI|nr:peptidoglycan recognition family protein [Paenalkalicoccus suaedae]QKS71648.1 N-acetylmuramoyl-L-alanine amidase [Paenalkalicoccus suaedae]QKS71701.1 N-acetylmuramoyl-L-alanine amidase [Paenalkalicoccus suaedae]
MNIVDRGFKIGNVAAMTPSAVRGVIIHHFGAPFSYTIENAQRDHSDVRRNSAGISSGIGYNGLVDTDGTKVQGRMFRQGAHARGYNGNHFGIATPGNFNSAKPSDVVLESMAEFTAWVLKQANLPVNATTVRGHRDVGSTDCPGRNFDMVDFRRRVQKYMGVTNVSAKPNNEPSAWAKATWEKATKAGIVDGNRPQEPVTRQEMAAMFDRAGLLDK